MKNLYSTLSELVAESNEISDEEYRLAGISKGLRKSNDEGILVGITNICDNYGRYDGIDCEGQIFYRGINLQDFWMTVIRESIALKRLRICYYLGVFWRTNCFRIFGKNKKPYIAG